MFAVRYLVLAALVTWLGGMIVLGLVVAPSAFRVLQETDPQGGRLMAGAVFGDVLRHFHLVAYGCGSLMIVGLFVLKFVGPPPAAFALRAGLAMAMLVTAVYTGGPLSQELTQLQANAGGPIAHLTDNDPRRVRFESLHSRSTMLMTVNIGLGLLSLLWYTRE